MKITADHVRKTVAPIFKKYGVKRARLFGSVASGSAGPASDVDILVSFRRPIDGWTYAGMARELEEVLLRPVDLVTENALSDHIRPRIESDLTPLYEER
ncbi:nucleotidyltransferase family protein [Candidatus Kaiserbacteria bacterium]|nr:nucleotidyltransferase family protein [Candidatus Kaiserbacteria bacterium]